jgi:hypothetical protein
MNAGQAQGEVDHFVHPELFFFILVFPLRGRYTPCIVGYILIDIPFYPS